jgi:hypothetical protein
VHFAKCLKSPLGILESYGCLGGRAKVEMTGMTAGQCTRVVDSYGSLRLPVLGWSTGVGNCGDGQIGMLKLGVA